MSAPTKNIITFNRTSEAVSNFLITDYLSTYDNGQYFEPPVNQNDLIKLSKTGLHHASAIQAKINVLASTFVETKYLSRDEFKKFAYNSIVLGNGYLELVCNRFGNVLCAKSRLGLYMRVASNLRDYVYLRGHFAQNEILPGNKVIHFKEHDLVQEVYGVPYYLAAIAATNLNTNATVFRNRYYVNGSHAGFIILSTGDLSDEDWDELADNLADTRGGGNFKNIMLRDPKADPDSLKLIPIAEVAAKDEFTSIKKISAADQLTIHRVPPQLMGTIPEAAGGFGDVEKAARVFFENEIKPIHQYLQSLNNIYGLKLFDFKDYDLATKSD